MNNGYIYTPPPPPERPRVQQWAMAVALLMSCVGVMLFISALWTGLYYTLGGE